jgi:hypothetical protein
MRVRHLLLVALTPAVAMAIACSISRPNQPDAGVNLEPFFTDWTV